MHCIDSLEATYHSVIICNVDLDSDLQRLNLGPFCRKTVQKQKHVW